MITWKYYSNWKFIIVIIPIRCLAHSMNIVRIYLFFPILCLSKHHSGINCVVTDIQIRCMWIWMYTDTQQFLILIIHRGNLVRPSYRAASLRIFQLHGVPSQALPMSIIWIQINYQSILFALFPNNNAQKICPFIEKSDDDLFHFSSSFHFFLLLLFLFIFRALSSSSPPSDTKNYSDLIWCPQNGAQNNSTRTYSNEEFECVCKWHSLKVCLCLCVCICCWKQGDVCVCTGRWENRRRDFIYTSNIDNGVLHWFLYSDLN